MQLQQVIACSIHCLSDLAWASPAFSFSSCLMLLLARLYACSASARSFRFVCMASSPGHPPTSSHTCHRQVVPARVTYCSQVIGKAGVISGQ